MKQTFKFKLYKNKKNNDLIYQIECARKAHNHCVALYRRYYKLFHKQLNVYALQKHLAKIKKLSKFSYMNEFGSQALQDVVKRIDLAYKKFFKDRKQHKKTGIPKFKSKYKYNSITLKQAGYKFGDDNTLVVNKQTYKFFKSRDILGVIKTLTIKRDNLGDIYIYVVCDVEQNEVMARTGKSVGFDFGLKQFLTANEAQYDVKAPEYLKENLKLIRKLYRELSRKQKGSNNRKKAKLNLNRAYRRIDNLRDEFQWKLANRLVGEFAFIGLEDLNIEGMKRLWGRKVSDLCFSSFLLKLEWCACKAGTIIVKVGKFFPSSQVCYDCGCKNPNIKDLKVRNWVCPNCGEHHDRDRNAANNILREALRIYQVA